MYYDVRPTKRIEIMQYTHTDKFGKVYSGTFTAIFRAYDPFGKLFRKAYGDVPTQMEKLETGMVSTYEMPWKPTTQSRDFLLYNCGTERAHTIIQIAGSATNMTIENKTTGQKCIINELRANDIPAGSYLEINSETEQVWLVKGEDKELAFYYHDMGYITLAPCVPFYGTMYVHFTLGSKEMRADGGTSFAPYMAGQYLMYYSNGVWFKIERVQDSKVAFLDREATRTAYNVVKVAPMNEILIYGTGINLSKLEIDYIPRIR
jgi:hypothetical protein